MNRIRLTFVGAIALALICILLGICGTLLVQNVAVAITFAIKVHVPDALSLAVGAALSGGILLALGYVAWRGVLVPRN